MAFVKSQIYGLKGFINEFFKEKEPWQIVAITTSTVLTITWIHECISQEKSKYSLNKNSCNFAHYVIISSLNLVLNIQE